MSRAEFKFPKSVIKEAANFLRERCQIKQEQVRMDLIRKGEKDRKGICQETNVVIENLHSFSQSIIPDGKRTIQLSGKLSNFPLGILKAFCQDERDSLIVPV